MAKRSPAVPRRRARSADRAHPFYELDLVLDGSDPPIWRSVLVAADTTLSDLHDVIQCVMPWQDCHLHQFHTKSRRRYAPPPPPDVPAFLVDDEAEDEREATLREVYDELVEKMIYEYDFGDSWHHVIKLVTTHLDAEAFEQLPVCVGGAMAAPPEDSGGIWGYLETVDILAKPDPTDSWHDEVIEFMGDFDPAAFDLDAANRRLGRCFPPRPRRSRSATK